MTQSSYFFIKQNSRKGNALSQNNTVDDKKHSWSFLKGRLGVICNQIINGIVCFLGIYTLGACL